MGHNVNNVLIDLRYGLRSLRKQPRSVVIIVITLGLGISAATAVFSVVNSALLSPLPYKNADRIVTLVQQKLTRGIHETGLAPANFVDIRNNNEAFDLAAAHIGLTRIITGADEPESLNGVATSASLFPLLGVDAQIGRVFSSEEDNEKAEPVVVISDDVWQRRFGGDSNVVNSPINLDGRPYTLVGIMPRGFRFPKEIDFWIPLGQQGKHLLAFRSTLIFSALARLKPGVSVEQAQAEVDVTAAQLEKSYPATNTGVDFRVIRFRDFIVRNARSSLLLLLAATAVLLLIAGVNVSNIFLARAVDRRREVAIRIALGATRWRMIRQFVLECLVITCISGALAVFIATRLADALSWLLPADHPNSGRINLDIRVLGLAVAVSLISGGVFGLISAWHSVPAQLAAFLKDSPAASIGHLDQRRIWSVLVVSEVALSVLLCVAAGLLMSSFIRLMNVNPGFDPSNVLIVGLRLNQPKYRAPHKMVSFQRELMEKLSVIPEVESAATSTFVPIGGSFSQMGVEAEGEPRSADPAIKACLQVVGGDYFRTLKIPLRAGRFFLESGEADSTKLAIINEAAAQQYFAGKDPIEKSIKLGGNAEPRYRVVGIVGNVRQVALEKESEPEVFLPYDQAPWSQYSLILKTRGNPTDVLGSVRSVVRGIDPEVPITKISTMEKLLAGSAMDRRLKATAFAIFAIFGSVLAAVGLYGLLSHWVRRRTHEIGVRMAIGASSLDVLGMIMKRGSLLIIIGLVTGLALSLYVNRFLSGLLYGVLTTDVPTLFCVCGFIVVTGLAACFVPAYKATRVDPVLALRNE